MGPAGSIQASIPTKTIIVSQNITFLVKNIHVLFFGTLFKNEFSPEAVPPRRSVLVLVEARLTVQQISTHLTIRLMINHLIVFLIITIVSIREITSHLTIRRIIIH